MPNIVQPWVEQLGLRYQGTLICAMRGCDGVGKEDSSKPLIRGLRGLVLEPASERPSSFINLVSQERINQRFVAFLQNFDHYPVHYVLHLMHAVEIIGYYHPNKGCAYYCDHYYRKFCRKIHMNPETKDQLNARLQREI